MDCPELKKTKGIHLERFRVVGGKELAAKSPAWAFGRSCSKLMNAFLKEKGYKLEKAQAEGELPWLQSGDEGQDPAEEESESTDKSDLKK